MVKTVYERQQDYRRRQADCGRIRCEFFLTCDEKIRVQRYVKKLKNRK